MLMVGEAFKFVEFGRRLIAKFCNWLISDK
jgi:hypothetical protein